MKLEATDYEITDRERPMAKLTRDIEDFVQIDIEYNVFTLKSWQEFSLLVEQGIIKLTGQSNDN